MLLKWLISGRADTAELDDDRVWTSHAARLKGVRLEVERLAAAGAGVLVVAWDATTLDEMAAAIAVLQPARCVDAFSRPALNSQLQRKGGVALALAKALSEPAQPVPARLEVLVCGRNQTRDPDNAVVRFANGAGHRARVAFHLSMDDALLKAYLDVRHLMETLKVPDDEAIISPMVTRSIRSLQEKNAR